jgi:Rrf2 family protein
MYVTARADYGLRATVELAGDGTVPHTVAQLAAAQAIPPRFLENILLILRHAGLLQSRRGTDGGFRLARPANEITLAEILSALEGPLPSIHGLAATELVYEGFATSLRDVWLAVSANLGSVLQNTTLENVARGQLPKDLRRLLAEAQALPSLGRTAS